MQYKLQAQDGTGYTASAAGLKFNVVPLGFWAGPMGNQVSCCGNGAVTEPEVAPGPAPKPQLEDEEDVLTSPKGVIEEARAKDVEETSPTSPTSLEKRQKFGSRVVSSCSLQGIHVDEEAEGTKVPAARLRAGTTNSLNVQLGLYTVVNTLR